MNSRYLFRSILTLLGMLSAFVAWSQPSPQSFLGYELGEEFTYHHRMVEYFQILGQQSGKVKFVEYGHTSERRPLVAAFISSEENIAALEDIRKANLSNIGLSTKTPSSRSAQKPMVWLSYNIHGNEAVGMEAAIKVAYSLVNNELPEIENWLEEVVVVIDPCENPDGRSRYASWYNQVKNRFRDVNSDTREHREPWPGGRFNHYLFDLNRDWAWQTQKETRHRIALYQQYMPHIHVDLHEMGINAPYFFSPAAEPFHKSITGWQREFHGLSGVNHAKYFDKQGWLYFTKETYDMFYPSYGDTWPTFNGAMGFTFEQGGSGRAGLAVETDIGDTLTLADRIAHHYTTSLSTIELGYKHRKELLKQFNEYFRKGSSSPHGKYKSYVVKTKSTPANRLRALAKLLDKQQIKYSFAPSNLKREFVGFDYRRNRNSRFSVSEGDLVVSAYQPQHHLVKVLFEPNPELSDSLTYDMTAWALPYVYGVEAYASGAKIELEESASMPKVSNEAPDEEAYAYAVAWNDLSSVKFLSYMLKSGMRVRYSEKDFTSEGKVFQPGSLLLLKGDNQHAGGFGEKLRKLADQMQVEATPIVSGLVQSGKDFGSYSVKMIKKPRVALLSGDGVSPTSYGELWHYFEQHIEYPVSSVNTSDLTFADLSEYDVLVLPSGRYSRYRSKILDFARDGGKVIAYGRALRVFESNGSTLKRAMEAFPSNEGAEGEELLKAYGERRREGISKGVEGSIFKVHLDKTHPLAFGLPDPFFLVKRNDRVYPYLPEGGWNVGVYKGDSHIAGFVGAKLKPKLLESLAFGTEPMGRGQVIYFPDSPTFRGFWHSGMGLMGNAVFLLQ